MHSTETICARVSNSRSNATQAERNTLNDFYTEKDAKNKAYAFILSRNLLQEFSEFCQCCDEETDWEGICRNFLDDIVNPAV